MTSYTAIDLSQLAPPDVVEALDYEAVLAALVADFKTRWQDYDADLESDPVVKVLEVAAYRELLLRARVNDAARAVLLATAQGADIDHIGALFGVARLLVTAADQDAYPPVAAVYESDANFRARIQLSLEGLTVAGSSGAYEFHARSADATVKDVDVFAPEPAGDYTGDVTITVLSTAGDGAPDGALLTAVETALNDETVRPLTDRLLVQGPGTIHTYAVTATLTFYAGPSVAEVLAAAQAAIEAYVDAHHSLGHDIALSGILAALHQPGVQNVDLTAPAADLVVAHDEVAYCTGITLTDGGLDE